MSAVVTAAPTAGYDEAAAAIRTGQATAGSLWVLLTDEHERDAYWLKPLVWEGPGEYQRVSYTDGRDGFVRLPNYRPLPKSPATLRGMR